MEEEMRKVNKVFKKEIFFFVLVIFWFSSGILKAEHLEKIAGKDVSVITLENEYIRVDVIPSLGGRIYRLIDKKAKRDYLYKPEKIEVSGGWYNYGGYEEYSEEKFASPGWKEKYKYKVIRGKGCQKIILTANLSNGFLLKREISLKEGAKRIEIISSLRNNTSYTKISNLRIHPIFFLGKDDYLYVLSDKGNLVRESLSYLADSKMKEVDFLPDAQGFWMVVDEKEEKGIANYFDKDKVKKTYVWVEPDSYNLEIFCKPYTLKPGEIFTFHNSYALLNGPDEIKSRYRITNLREESDPSLIACYHFDEGEGIVVRDSSGNNNNGKISGAKWVKGKKGTGLKFGSKKDVVVIPNSKLLNPKKELTIEAWVFWEAPGPEGYIWGHIVRKRNFTKTGGNNSYLLAIYNKNRRVAFAINGCGRKGEPIVVSDVRVKKNGWSYIAGIYDGSKLTVVVDGIPKSKSTDQKEIIPNDKPLYIGGRWSGSYFNGIIDEVKIYNRALSLKEIDEHFGKARKKFLKGLIGYWPMDEGEGKIVYNKANPMLYGKIVNGVWSKGERGSGLEFISDLRSFVIIPSQLELNLTDKLTISAWIWPSDTFGRKAIVSKGNQYRANGYNFCLYNKKLQFCRKPEGSPERYAARWVSSSPLIEPKTWSYVACSYDATSGKVIFYHNGVKSDEALLKPKKIAYFYPKCPVVIGAMGLYPRDYWSFSGFIKQVKIYNRVLTPEEIKEDYEKTKNIANLRLETKQERYEKTLTSKVKAEIFDLDTKKPLNARVYLEDENGIFYFPKESFHYGKNKIYFYAFGNFESKIKPGKFILTVLHGFEYEPKRISFKAEKGKETNLKIGLKRLVNMPSLGWYASDWEIQYWGHAGVTPYTLKMGLKNAVKIFQAEGLNHIHSPAPSNYGGGIKDKKLAPSLKTSDFVADLGGETHTMIDDDILCLNISSYPRINNIYNLPMIEQVEKQGGLAIPSGIGRLGKSFDNVHIKENSRFFPVYVALRKVPVCPDSGSSIVYKYWNLGFKLSISGKTDCYIADPPRSCIPGRSRTYVKADELSVPGICEGYKKGKTIFTNGPLIIFNVEGKDIGETVFLKKGKHKLKINLKAYSVTGLEKIEIIKNGNVIKTISGEGKKRIEKQFNLEIEHTCWLAAKCIGKKNEFFGTLAHTSPVYIQVGKEKMIPKQEDIEYFLLWLSKLRDFTKRWLEANKNNRRFMGQWKKLSSGYYEAIDKAENIYKSLSNNPRDWAIK
ncbi:MAG: hypothetical protein DRI36_02970 [Caldiserica bacterium]|nr:MAG: hypothetical protein DRI36_02970 [Caldisericota bacterium]